MKAIRIIICLFITGVLSLVTTMGTAGNLYTSNALDGTTWVLSVDDDLYITFAFSEGICDAYYYDLSAGENGQLNVGSYAILGNRINIWNGSISGEWSILEDTLIILDDEGYGYSFERLSSRSTGSHSTAGSSVTSVFANTHWHAVGMNAHNTGSAQGEYSGTGLEDLAWLANGAVTFVPHIRDLKSFQTSLLTAYFGIDFYSNGTWEVHFECWSMWADLLSETSLDAETVNEHGVWTETNGTIFMYASSGAPIPLKYDGGVLSISLFGLSLDFVPDR